jgi:putative flippase GtrA
MRKNTQPLSRNDLLFGAINGAMFGAMAAIILANYNALSVHPILIFLFFVILATIGIGIGWLLSRLFASFFFQLAKFGAVGAANFSVDIGVLNLLMLLTQIASGPFFTLFKAISFVAAVTNSYFWNKHWSFGDKSRNDIQKEFSQFFLVSVIGALINISTSHILVNIIGPLGGINEKLWATLAAAIAAVIVLSWNFLGYKFIVFKNEK